MLPKVQIVQVESSKEQHLFKIEIFCHIINVILLSLLINLMHLIPKKNHTDSKHLNDRAY